MIEEPQEPLSPAGQARREQIRRLAQRAASRKRWRRRGTEVIVGLAVVSAVGRWAWRAHPESPVPSIPPPRRLAVAPPAAPAEPARVTSVVSFVETDPTISDRWSAPSGPPRWVVIDDRQLLDALAAAGRPAWCRWTAGKRCCSATCRVDHGPSEPTRGR